MPPRSWPRSGTILSQSYSWLGYPVLVTTSGKFKVAPTAGTFTLSQIQVQAN